MKTYRVINSHTHPFGKSDIDLSRDVKTMRDGVLLRRRNPKLWRDMFEQHDDLADDLVRDMDRYGIDLAIIQSRGIGGSNEDVAAAVKRHPNRLVGLFRPSYDLNDRGKQSTLDYEALARDLEYWVDDLGLKGMGEVRIGRFTSHSAPEKIADDLTPLMRVLAPRKLPVMFLTAWTQFGSALYHGMPLFIDDLAERFPELPIIITKMGRGYDALFEMCLLVAYKHENVYLDTVQTRPDHLARAIAEIGAERVMFGTDWEQTWCAVREPADLYTRSLAIVEESDISEAQKEWVLGKTAATLYGI